MTFLDIHAHVLPDVDDGAKNIEASIQLLEILKQQGVTDVVATPHFYPDEDNAEEFAERVRQAYDTLKRETKTLDLPKVHLGCELRYFSGIGKSRAIKQFAIKGTDYLLLELTYGAPVTKQVLQDIIDIGEQQGLVPVLAHIERYNKVPGFKKLLKLISDGFAVAHINASAVVDKDTARLCEKLIKGGFVSYIASDTHSVEHRPPQIKQALDLLSERIGRSAVNKLIIKSNQLLEIIEEANEE